MTNLTEFKFDGKFQSLNFHRSQRQDNKIIGHRKKTINKKKYELMRLPAAAQPKKQDSYLKIGVMKVEMSEPALIEK